MDSSIDETNSNLKLTPPTYTNNHEYVGGTNEKTRDSQTRESDDYPSDTDGCARNLDDGNWNEEDENYIDPPFKKKYIIESKSEEDVINRLLPKNNHSKQSERLCLTSTTTKKIF